MLDDSGQVTDNDSEQPEDSEQLTDIDNKKNFWKYMKNLKNLLLMKKK
jgi:hypothetical protein